MTRPPKNQKTYSITDKSEESKQSNSKTNINSVQELSSRTIDTENYDAEFVLLLYYWIYTN